MLDRAAQAKERERLRIEDQLRQLDTINQQAAIHTDNKKNRYGWTWDGEAERAGLAMLAAAAVIGDSTLLDRVEALRAIHVSHDDDARVPAAELDTAYKDIVMRTAELRREKFVRD
jgi:hypothetical protein